MLWGESFNTDCSQERGLIFVVSIRGEGAYSVSIFQGCLLAIVHLSTHLFYETQPQQYAQILNLRTSGISCS